MNWVKSRVKEQNAKKKQNDFFARQRNALADTPTSVPRRTAKQPTTGRSLDFLMPPKGSRPSTGATLRHKVVQLDLDKFASSHRITTVDLGPVSPLQQNFLSLASGDAHNSGFVGVQQRNGSFAEDVITTQPSRFELPVFLANSSSSKHQAPAQNTTTECNRKIPARNAGQISRVARMQQTFDWVTDVEPDDESEQIFNDSPTKFTPKITSDEVTKNWSCSSAGSSNLSSNSNRTSFAWPDSRISCESFQSHIAKPTACCKTSGKSQSRLLQGKFMAATSDILRSPSYYTSSPGDFSSHKRKGNFNTEGEHQSRMPNAIHNPTTVSSSLVFEDDNKPLVCDEFVVPASSVCQSNFHRRPMPLDDKSLLRETPDVYLRSSVLNSPALYCTPRDVQSPRYFEDTCGSKRCSNRQFTFTECQLADKLRPLGKESLNKSKQSSSLRCGLNTDPFRLSDSTNSQSSFSSENKSDCSYPVKDGPSMRKKSHGIIQRAWLQEPTRSMEIKENILDLNYRSCGQRISKAGLGICSSVKLGEQRGLSGEEGSTTHESRLVGKRRWMDELSSITTINPRNYWRQESAGDQNSLTYDSRDSKRHSIAREKDKSTLEGSPNIVRRGLPGVRGHSSLDSYTTWQRRVTSNRGSSKLESNDIEEHSFTGMPEAENPVAGQHAAMSDAPSRLALDFSSCNSRQRKLTDEQDSSLLESRNISKDRISEKQCNSKLAFSTYSTTPGSYYVEKRKSTGEHNSSVLDDPIYWWRTSAGEPSGSSLESFYGGKCTSTGEQNRSNLDSPIDWQGGKTVELKKSSFESCRIEKSRSTGEENCSILDSPVTRQRKLTGEQGDSYPVTSKPHCMRGNDNVCEITSKVQPSSTVCTPVTKNALKNEANGDENISVGCVNVGSEPTIHEWGSEQITKKDQQVISLNCGMSSGFSGSVNEDCARKQNTDDYSACVNKTWSNKVMSSVVSCPAKQNTCSLSTEALTVQRCGEQVEEENEDPIIVNSPVLTTAVKSTSLMLTPAGKRTPPITTETVLLRMKTSSDNSACGDGDPMQTSSQLVPPEQTELCEKRAGSSHNVAPRSYHVTSSNYDKRVTSSANTVLCDPGHGYIATTPATMTSATSSDYGNVSICFNRNDSLTSNTELAIEACSVAGSDSINSLPQSIKFENTNAINSDKVSDNVATSAIGGSIASNCRSTSPVNRLRIKTHDRQTSPVFSWLMKDASTSPITRSWLEAVGRPVSLIDCREDDSILAFPSNSVSLFKRYIGDVCATALCSSSHTQAPLDKQQLVMKLDAKCPTNTVPSIVQCDQISTQSAVDLEVFKEIRNSPVIVGLVTSCDDYESNHESLDRLSKAESSKEAVNKDECRIDDTSVQLFRPLRQPITHNLDDKISISGVDCQVGGKEDEALRRGNGMPNNECKICDRIPFLCTAYGLDYDTNSGDSVDANVDKTKGNLHNKMQESLSSEEQLFDAVGLSDTAIQATINLDEFVQELPSAAAEWTNGDRRPEGRTDDLNRREFKLQLKEGRPINSSSEGPWQTTLLGNDRVEDEQNLEVPEWNSLSIQI